MNDKIEFGNNVGYKINDYSTKKKIIDFLLNNIEPYNFKYNNINEEETLLKIKNTQYFVSPNISGDNFVFIAIKINGIYYNVLVNKSFTNDIKNINYNNITMLSIKIRLCNNSYNGTIFDGRIVNLGGCSVFLINDSFMLYGENLLESNISDRYSKTNKFLDESYIIDNNMNVIDFRLNKLTKLDDIKDLVYNRMKKSKYNFDSIIFIPKISKDKYIYHLSNTEAINLEKLMYGKKIDTDVVELFTKDQENELIRIGIAHIPTIKCSRICTEHITDKLTIIKCKLNTSFKKWEPIEIYMDNNISVSPYEEIKEIMMNFVTKEK